MNRILATLSFFTRLPFWRLSDIPKEAYERVVPLWPLAGWLTSLIMYAVMYAAFNFLGYGDGLLCYVLALLARIIVTGALHEDGLADFCDGFGGGTTRERTLEIMKDSHIGTYGVIGLIIYFLIITNAMCGVMNYADTIIFNDPSGLPIEQWKSTPLWLMPFTILFTADVMSKAVCSLTIYCLPYSRKESEAKNKLVYTRSTIADIMLTLLVSLVPCALLITFVFPKFLMPALVSLVVTIITHVLLMLYMRRRIGGYTGDCCGAMFIICECVFYLTLLVMSN